MKKDSKNQKVEVQKKNIVLAVIGVALLVGITLGISMAFFSYTKEGSTDNTIKTGTLSFLYTEVSKIGRGILLEDALPLDNDLGKAQTGEGKVFDFNILSTTQSNVEIPYTVTARMSSDSDLDPSIVDLYLTDKNSNNVFLDVTSYSNLPKYNNMDSERIIYSTKVPKDSEYNQDFRFRMWIDENTKYSPLTNNDGSFKLDENGNYIYLYNDQIFKVTINVYANGQLISDNNTSNDPTVLYAGTNKGGYLHLGSQVDLDNYQTGYTKNDAGLAYLKYDVDSAGTIVGVQGCLAASTNADEVCLYTEGNNIYETNKQIVLDYFGLDSTTIASKCPVYDNSEVLCEDDKISLGFNDGPGIWITNKENNKTCLAQVDFGVYDCK